MHIFSLLFAFLALWTLAKAKNYHTISQKRMYKDIPVVAMTMLGISCKVLYVYYTRSPNPNVRTVRREIAPPTKILYGDVGVNSLHETRMKINLVCTPSL